MTSRCYPGFRLCRFDNQRWIVGPCAGPAGASQGPKAHAKDQKSRNVTTDAVPVALMHGVDAQIV